MAFLSSEEWTSFKSACLKDGVLIERVIKSFYKRALNHDDVAFDVGAHVGYHSTGLAERLSNGVVVACEGNPITYLKLLKSLSKLRTYTPILTINAAIQDDSDKKAVTFNISAEHPGRSGLMKSWNNLEYEQRTVSARTLDDIHAALELQKLNFIKCDVEGTEFEVFLGAEKVLTTYRPIIVLEHAERKVEGFQSRWLKFFTDKGLIPYFPNGVEVTEDNFYDFWYIFLFPEERAESLLELLHQSVSNWEAM